MMPVSPAIEPTAEAPIASEAGVLELLLAARRRPANCGEGSRVLPESLRDWMRTELACVAGRREFVAGRYFAVDVRQRSDVVYGWRRFVEALEQRAAVACLYIFPELGALAEVSAPGAAGSVNAVAECMSLLSDAPGATLAHGGQLNFIMHLNCPVTGCRTAFHDFDAVAFVPEAANRADPLYDPLMSAPMPMVNINSDVYGFSMFTRDHCRQRFECEVTSLTRRERRFLFRYSADSWQRMAEKTIRGYAAQVDQDLCPTHLVDGGRAWVANHRDPAFAEQEKRAYLHEMPLQYTPRVLAEWDKFFERGIAPNYEHVALPGEATGARRCPMSVHS